MSTSNQARFFAEIRKTLEESHADMVELARQREEFRRKVDGGILTGDYADAEIESIGRKIAKIHNECEGRLQGMIAARLEELDAADAMTAEGLNQDCQLLQFDFLTQRDIDEIAKRNSSNATVSRLVQRYAEAHGFEVEMPPYLAEINQAKKEVQDVQEVVRVALKWIGNAKDGQRVLARLIPQFGV